MAEKEFEALRDLEALLRKSINDQVTVVNYTTSPLVPPGENYASLLIKVDAVIRRSNDSPEEELNLVAKLIPRGEYQLNVIRTAVTFGKEIFFFEKLAPHYKQLEDGTDLKSESLKDLFPEFYGARLVEDEKKPGRALENTILLLKNIKVDGYNNVDRRKGLDLKHAKLALSELARFHGLGMVARKELSMEAKRLMSEVPFEMDNSEAEKFMENILTPLSQDPRTDKHLERIRAAIKAVDWRASMTEEPVEPWVSITHNDFWVNNMMFRKDEDGELSVKFIDFQTLRVSSPVGELPYFVFGSANSEVLNQHFDEILDFYYDRLIDVLRKTGCDASECTKKSFYEELDHAAKINLFRCISAVKFFTLEQTEADRIETSGDVMLAVGGAGSELYYDRVNDIVSKYIEKGWL